MAEIRSVRLANGTSSWLAPVITVTAVAVTRSRNSRPWAIAVPPLTILAGLMLWFFRDPERPIGEGRILSPADGVVQSIEPWPDRRTRVAIFMGPLDVHVNRAPCDGTVTSVQHVEGDFLPAFDKNSDRNERLVWHLDTAFGDLEFVQIAGAVARRIVRYAAVGQKLSRGERIGMIRFGSRVDIYLPIDTSAAVATGQRIRAGQTRLA